MKTAGFFTMLSVWSLISVSAFAQFLSLNEAKGFSADEKIAFAPSYQVMSITVTKGDSAMTVPLDPKQAESFAATLDKIPALMQESQQTQIYDPGKELLRLQLKEGYWFRVVYVFLQGGNRKVQVEITQGEKAVKVELPYGTATTFSKNMRKAFPKLNEKPAAPTAPALDPYRRDH